MAPSRLVTIVLVSLHPFAPDDAANAFVEHCSRHGGVPSGVTIATHVGRVQDYVPPSDTVLAYVSPANSLLLMHDGVDVAYACSMWPGVEQRVRTAGAAAGRRTRLGRPYLPIGSAVAVWCPAGGWPRQPRDAGVGPAAWLLVAPTMLLPQRVDRTRNAYWAARAVLRQVDALCQPTTLVLPLLACGYGGMTPEASGSQVADALLDHVKGATTGGGAWLGGRTPHVSRHGAADPAKPPLLWLCEPNLDEQPKTNDSAEWMDA